MKVLIAGSRTVHDYNKLLNLLKPFEGQITEVISGGALGVDRLGERYAKENNIQIKQFLPNWDLHGKKAGILRNIDMVEYCDIGIVIWDGKSRGTKFTLDKLKQSGKYLSYLITG